MSLCFQSFSYPPNVNCCVTKHTSHKQGNKNQSLLKLPSSIIRQSEGNNDPFLNKSSSNKISKFPLTDQPNGIGIIGGLSVDSSLNFAKKLANLKSEDEENIPPFVLCSDPTLSKELSILERSSFSFFPAKSEDLISIDKRSIVEKLRRKRMFLEKSGVCCLVMPCDLSHFWYDEIEEGCCVRFLHVGECVAKELKEAKLRPIEAGSPIRIGVLATNEALVSRFYKEKLENEGFEVILPDKATVEHTIIPAVEALNREDFEGAQNLFRIALQVLIVRAVNRVILASDDLRQLLPPNDPLWAKCIDPMDCLARSSIEYAQSAGIGK